MKSPYNFIVTPHGEQYNNVKDIDGVKLVINTSLESSKHVNRVAEVLEVPIHYDGQIKKGDLVLIHHNVFRTYYDMKGRQTRSPEYFRDDVYIVNPERLYLYNRDGKWNSHLNFCFVKPIDIIQDSDVFNLDKEQKHTGVLMYPSKKQQEEGFKPNDLIAFTKNSEYGFDVDGEKLYRMYDRDVVIKLN
jgi:hypothetical protein